MNSEMKTLYLLDRNIVSIIKKANKKEKIIDFKKSEKLNFLLAIDNSKSIVSPILSMIEGQKGRQENLEEKKKVAEKETEEVEKFFSRAKTDKNTIDKMIDLFADTFQHSLELDWDNTENFLRESAPHIAQKVSKENLEKIKKIIINNAINNKIPKSHLALILCLSCLYGCESSREVIKPHRKDKIYNAMNDIYVIPRISLIKSLQKSLGAKNLDIEFVTCDEGLEKTMKNVEISDLKMTNNGEGIIQRIQYKKPLFPQLTKAQYLSLMKELTELSAG